MDSYTYQPPIGNDFFFLQACNQFTKLKKKKKLTILLHPIKKKSRNIPGLVLAHCMWGMVVGMRHDWDSEKSGQLDENLGEGSFDRDSKAGHTDGHVSASHTDDRGRRECCRLTGLR